MSLEDIFPISALDGEGINDLLQFTKKYLPNSRQKYQKKKKVLLKKELFYSEVTREKIYNNIHKEIPYNIEVTNKTFKYLKNGQLKIKQDIIINNDRYKKILLGRKGSKIKDIRIKSQKEISNILNIKTHLYINIISSDAKKI